VLRNQHQTQPPNATSPSPSRLGTSSEQGRSQTTPSHVDCTESPGPRNPVFFNLTTMTLPIARGLPSEYLSSVNCLQPTSSANRHCAKSMCFGSSVCRSTMTLRIAWLAIAVDDARIVDVVGGVDGALDNTLPSFSRDGSLDAEIGEVEALDVFHEDAPDCEVFVVLP